MTYQSHTTGHWLSGITKKVLDLRGVERRFNALFLKSLGPWRILMCTEARQCLKFRKGCVALQDCAGHPCSW